MGYGSGVRGRKVKSRDCALASDLVRACQTLSGPLPQSGSPAREARGAAAAAPRENGPQRQASKSPRSHVTLLSNQ